MQRLVHATPPISSLVYYAHTVCGIHEHSLRKEHIGAGIGYHMHATPLRSITHAAHHFVSLWHNGFVLHFVPAAIARVNNATIPPDNHGTEYNYIREMMQLCRSHFA